MLAVETGRPPDVERCKHCVQATALDQPTCDWSGNTKGDKCPSSAEGAELCDPAVPADQMVCRNGVLQGKLQCPPPSQCRIVSNQATCV